MLGRRSKQSPEPLIDRLRLQRKVADGLNSDEMVMPITRADLHVICDALEILEQVKGLTHDLLASYHDGTTLISSVQQYLADRAVQEGKNG